MRDDTVAVLLAGIAHLQRHCIPRPSTQSKYPFQAQILCSPDPNLTLGTCCHTLG